MIIYTSGNMNKEYIINVILKLIQINHNINTSRIIKIIKDTYLTYLLKQLIIHLISIIGLLIKHKFIY